MFSEFDDEFCDESDDVPPLVVDVGSFSARVGPATSPSPLTLVYEDSGYKDVLCDDAAALKWGGEPEGRGILVVEDAMTTRRQREATAQLLFETLGTPELACAHAGVLALIATGRESGVVVDAGHSQITATPVYELSPLMDASRRVCGAGAELTECIARALKATLAAARRAKETMCCVAAPAACQSPSPSFGAPPPSGSPRVSLLPRAADPVLQRAPEELLFGPASASSLPSLVRAAVAAADPCIALDLMSSVVLAGGTSLVPGVDDRLSAELGRRVVAPAGRDALAWAGGAVVATRPQYRSAWVGRMEYEEVGPAALARGSL
eukprot:m51a1_g8976 putative other eukaryote (323) ;mRNA; r:33845-35266